MFAPWQRDDVADGSVVETKRPIPVISWYSNLTGAYAHGVLGDALEPTRLHVWTERTSAHCGNSIEAGAGHVFEDIAPRIVNLDRNGHPEIIAIRSHMDKGAQLAIYRDNRQGLKLIAATPYIGQANRWLAPVGAADLDGDGRVEIAYVDRPHLAKRLRIWRFKAGKLRHVRDVEGLTNHKIGWDFIVGGIRDCGQGPEIITADASWRRIVATTFADGRARSRDLRAYDGPKSFDPVMGCRQ
ncbi:VCBS repeat-containing protein [Alisedimentitalea sp. MJ-SS2]|nr:VCBS repeat-containing protein [Alisedimentitalea sp. MJ-SS2]